MDKKRKKIKIKIGKSDVGKVAKNPSALSKATPLQTNVVVKPKVDGAKAAFKKKFKFGFLTKIKGFKDGIIKRIGLFFFDAKGNLKITVATLFWPILAIGAIGFLAYSSTKKAPNKVGAATSISDKGDDKLALYGQYGYNFDDYQVRSGLTDEGQALGDFLQSLKVNPEAASKLSEQAFQKLGSDVLSDSKYFLLSPLTAADQPKYLLINKSAFQFDVYDLEQNKVESVFRNSTVQVASFGGIVQEDLWQSLLTSGLAHPHKLLGEMEAALGGRIDFHHLERGDKFKVVFEQHFVDGKAQAIASGRLLAVDFVHKGQAIKAYRLSDTRGFYDDQGMPLRSSFLQAPVAYTRISDPFGKRINPLSKQAQMHGGTDYAAPAGTPIVATANGTIKEVSKNPYNGNFVRIEHSDNIQTTYLHMSKFATITVGQPIRQGETIGFVGQTGNATGPHVCYRFKLNGKEVDHRTVKVAAEQSDLAAQELTALQELQQKFGAILAKTQLL